MTESNGSSASDSKFWKHHLMVLQESAPKPVVVDCTQPPSARRPPYYGNEFHGVIERQDADRLLAHAGEGERARHTRFKIGVI